MRLYVGNLAFRSNAEDVRKAFAAFGQVSSVDLAMDRGTGRSAGFAFVEMPNDEEAQTAIQRLKEINSRVVSVHEAARDDAPRTADRPRDESRRRSQPHRTNAGKKPRDGF